MTRTSSTARIAQAHDAEIKADPFGYALRSVSELHHRLGKMVESRPGVVDRIEPYARPLDSNQRHFEGLTIDSCVRPVSGAGQHEIDLARESMGEAEWARLNAEWLATPEPRSQGEVK